VIFIYVFTVHVQKRLFRIRSFQ